MGAPNKYIGKYLSVCDTDLKQRYSPIRMGIWYKNYWHLRHQLQHPPPHSLQPNNLNKYSHLLPPLIHNNHIVKRLSQLRVHLRQFNRRNLNLIRESFRLPRHHAPEPTTTDLYHLKEPVIRQRLVEIAREVQQYHKQIIPFKHQELECAHVFSSPLDGFGIDGLQLYIRPGECVTWLHDNLLWCSALNYMLKESQGCALWIAVG